MKHRQSTASGAADYSLRVVQALISFVSDELGEAALVEIAAAAELDPATLRACKAWVPVAQLEALLEAVFERLDRDEARFTAACSHRLAEGYGPMRYIVWATSPKTVLMQAARTIHLVSRVSSWDILELRRNRVRARYTSTVPEGRLLCLLRQVTVKTLPTLWGLPPASLEETSCIALGDDCCEYQGAWFEAGRWIPAACGLALGVCAAVALIAAGMLGSAGGLSLALLGAALGHLYELQRVSRANLAFGQQSQAALGELSRQEAEARQELLAFSQRQARWTRLLEEQVADRTGTLERVVDQLHELQQERVTTLRGFSHDLRNPLTVLRMMSDQFKQLSAPAIPEWRSVVEDHAEAVAMMETLLTELMETATAEVARRGAAEPLSVAPLAERLRGRLRALVFGRDIRVSVFSSREAPESIEIIHLLFDRIVDNLLSNAAKYTEQGSIVVEIAGIPDFLVIKVSDTGRGISPERIAGVFSPRGQGGAAAPQSYGLGLSVVVQLLSEIGGRLEVMSKPGEGTTFWVYFPQQPAQQRERTRIEKLRRPDRGDLVGEVVTIRRMNGA